MVLPGNDDVVIRQKDGTSSTVYLLETPGAPGQFTVKTRDRAVTLAVGYARRFRVRVWFAESDKPLVLLRTFRAEEREPVRSADADSQEHSEVGSASLRPRPRLHVRPRPDG